ncbi:unnamed protein product [Aphanomyces euteiches]
MATQDRMEILLAVRDASKEVDKDVRSFLYVDDDEDALHGLPLGSIVSIRRSADDDEPLAFARLQSKDALTPHESSSAPAIASYGLALALQSHFGLTPVESAEVDDEESVQVFRVQLDGVEMSIPTATHVVLHLPLLHKAPHAAKIVRSMERIAPQLLSGTLVWPNRLLRLTWRHQIDLATISLDVPIAFISSSSSISIETAPSSALPPAPLSVPDTLDAMIADIKQHMAGHDAAIRRVVSMLIHSLFSPPSQKSAHDAHEEALRSLSARSVLLSGVPSIGKTHFVNLLRSACSTHLGMSILSLSGPDLFQTKVGDSEKKLLDTFAAARQSAPTLLCIEDIDAMAAATPAASSNPSPLEQSLLGVLLACLDCVNSAASSRIFVIATTNRLEYVHDAIRRNGRLEHLETFRPPNQQDRAAMLAMICRQVDATPDILAQIAARTNGFVAADLLNLVREATLVSCRPGCRPGDLNDLAAVWEPALAVVKPSMLHGQALAARPTERPLLFGLDDALATLRVSLLQPLHDSSPFRTMGVLPPRGILVTGSSGVGKSQLLSVIAHDVGSLATCLTVQCTDLISKQVGGTEKALATLFATARAAAPCVLLFDQIESLAPVRGFDTTTEQTFDRVLSLLLLEMDGFASASPADMQRWSHAQFVQQHVVLVATTTSASLLDPSILRPGRFDIEISIEKPNEDARKQALMHLVEKTPVQWTEEIESKDSLVAWLAHKTEGATIGQLNAIFQDAAMASLRQSIDVDHLSPSALETACRHVMGDIRRDEEEEDVNELVSRMQQL